MAKVGGIVENPEMYKYLTGRQNLECCRRMYDDLPESRVDEVTALVRLEERIGDKVSKYSLGMRQPAGTCPGDAELAASAGAGRADKRA